MGIRGTKPLVCGNGAMGCPENHFP
jgi:hypothetical protein